ncbi:unnamed protein product, partial [Nesidiocoris tenuis]
MSFRLSTVFLSTSAGGARSETSAKEEPPSSAPAAKPPPAVAIVTPHRSSSLDILNFEEKRQLIASSLSLTDFLNKGGSATSPSSPTSGSFY